MSAFLKQLGAVKVKEVPDFFRKTVTYENFLTHGEKFAMEYKARSERKRGKGGEGGGGRSERRKRISLPFSGEGGGDWFFFPLSFICPDFGRTAPRVRHLCSPLSAPIRLRQWRAAGARMGATIRPRVQYPLKPNFFYRSSSRL